MNIPTESIPIPPAPDGLYFSEVCFEASDDAFGTFAIPYIGAPNMDTFIAYDFPCIHNCTVFDELVISVVDAVGACCLVDSCLSPTSEEECEALGGFHYVLDTECLLPDCNDNRMHDECDLVSGVSADCNTNGIPDECDIAGGTSGDCNLNAVPDACDLAAGTSPDCNANSVPDECDISDGTSRDVFPPGPGGPDGIPDECQTREADPVQ